LDAAETWPEILAVNVALYTGARRAALAQLRLRDYNQATRKLKFFEKGGKAIEKAVADELATVLDAAIAIGVYQSPDDYLIPSEGRRPADARGDRDDRFLWRIITRLGRDVGVKVHVHALRAAFATFYLENHPGDIVGLQNLMGHSSSEVTKVYLRKLDRQQAMEPVRGLSWRSVAPAGYAPVARFPQTAGKALSSSLAVGAGGFEPPSPDTPHGYRAGTQPAGGSA
jgi:integrase